ncbi:iron-sulfur cluster assembly accessory protein [Dyadobacter luteus]|jgi:iron-sulfur cluster assembly protein|uniref:Iron-sulfur cluster assembly accessory protein n=1 Tax=Dyadobacter luteus TaxID=2259619 RepID=A0A3D8YF15_9BACT|nr:iron-sulfur cluster biosynthesis family protein [Dyadobacter luteus]REA61607.1 iron-sulfur cluster assembly accessory protein [Dyadobacter luteus]
MEDPITITEAAREEIISTLQANKIPDSYGLRVGLKGGACSGTFLLGFDTQSEFDQLYLIDGIRVYIDRRHLMYVVGLSVDYEEGMNGSGYTVSTLSDKQ